MADGTGHFRAEVETIRHFGPPAFDGFLGRDGVKGGIALHSGQTPGVLVQEVGGFCLQWIEIPHPALEGPNRTTDVEIHKLII